MFYFLYLLIATLLPTVLADGCDPTILGYENGREVYCSGRAEGWSGGSAVIDQCVKDFKTCPCGGDGCYGDGLFGLGRKCRSAINSDKDFCYTGETHVTYCQQGQQRVGWGCNANSWECTGGTCQRCPTNTYSTLRHLKCQECSSCSGTKYTKTYCWPGSEVLAGHDTECEDCPSGSACTNGGKVLCYAGYFCNNGIMTPCDSSLAMICDSTGMSQALEGCRRGHKFSSGLCIPCPSETYLSMGGSDLSHKITTCTPCAAGSFQASTGSSACTPCTPGTFRSLDMGALQCLPCNSGKYQTGYGQTHCVSCSPGTYMPQSSSGVPCFDCPAGRYSSTSESTECLPCLGNTYSDRPASTNCSACPPNMTIFQYGPSESSTETIIPSPNHNSVQKCNFCPPSFYTCNCPPTDFTCIKDECQLSLLCVSCPEIGFFCPSDGQKIAQKTFSIGKTYVVQEGDKTHDAIIGNCKVCQEDTEYASNTCGPENTVCSLCGVASPLFTYASTLCTPKSDAIISPCNISQGDLRPGIGACNLCPPGSTYYSAEGCQVCPSNTFSKIGGNETCKDCPPGTISGPGASTCTAICSAGSYSKDGKPKNCIPLHSSAQNRIVAQWKQVSNLEMGTQLANEEMLVITNSASGGGTVWRMSMGESANVYGDDSGTLGTITAFVSVFTTDSSSQLLLMADIDEKILRARIRILTYDFRLGQISSSSILTLISYNTHVFPSSLISVSLLENATAFPFTDSGPKSISAIQLENLNSENVFYVADPSQHSIFKIWKTTQLPNTFYYLLWRGSTGYPSTLRNLQQPHLETTDWLLSRPTHMAPHPNASFNLMFVLDDIGIWSFKTTDNPTLQPNSNLNHVCGRKTSLNISQNMSCSTVDFQIWGAFGLTATADASGALVILVAFQRSAQSGILSVTGGVVQELIPRFEYNLMQQFVSSLFVSKRGIFATLGGTTGQVAEIGIHSCLCDAGFYCDTLTRSCLQSPVGFYSPSWSARPIPCKPGTISGGPGGKDEALWCKSCSRADFTTSKESALNCEPLCPLTSQRFSVALGECVQGCNYSIGEYLDLDEKTCKVCPIGAGAVPGNVGKGLINGCPPCQPPLVASISVPGTCKQCPPPLLTLFAGATICMPPTHTPFFADGLLIMSNVSDTNGDHNGNSTTPIFFNQTSPTSITSISVNSGGIIFIATGDAVWKLNRVTQLPLSTPTLIAEVSPAWNQGDFPFGLIEISDDGTTIFLSEQGGTCIWKMTLNTDDVQRPNVLAADTPCWAGYFNLPGDMNGFGEVARLGYISSLALMEVEGRTSILYVSTKSASSGCTNIRSISLYDRSMSTFLSYDQLQSPLVLMNYCPSLPFPISIPRGTDQLFFAYGPDIRLIEVYSQNQSVAASNYLNYGLDVDFSLDNNSIVASMCSKADGTLAVLEGNSGDVIIVGPRVWSVGKPLVAETVSKGIANNSNKILECAGQHIWHADSRTVYESSYKSKSSSTTLLSGCIGGFVLDTNNACMQVGIGQYSIPSSSQPLNCKGGTYGTVGGSLHVSCKDCPPGYTSIEGSLGCQECPPSRPYSFSGSTACASQCPPSTYITQKKTCTSCPPGFFGPPGATSISECKPCPAGTYINETTLGLCASCPNSWSSLAGSHTCVKVCSSGQCAADGITCKPLTSNWEIITSVTVPRGVFIRAIAVSRGGGVFYTDNDFIKYFLDDCPAHLTLDEAEICSKSGTDLLPELCFGCSRGISAMVLTQNFASDSVENKRYLYFTSITTHNVYRIPILYKQGTVDIKMTIASIASDFQNPLSSSSFSNIFSDFWLVIGNLNGIAGFVDGSFASARLNLPSEIEISASDSFLIISDSFNHRIRLADLTTHNLSTILGTGYPCWNEGVTSACNADNAKLCTATNCASANMPLGVGLSSDESTLYVAMNQENAVGKLSNPLSTSTQREFSMMCRFISSQRSNSRETCEWWSEGSKSCMLFRPYDVIIFENTLYASVAEGITKIDLDSSACQQIGGSYWDFNPKTSRDFIDGGISTSSQTSDARMHQPFRLALAQDRGILYIADMKNGAIRRMFINGRCKCPGGSIYVVGSRSCYNPTQKWSSKTLVQCPDGQYALEGETTCQACSDASVYKISTPIACTLWNQAQAAMKKMRERGFSYAKVVGNPKNPQNRVSSDWYGSNPPLYPNWDDIFNEASTVKYNMGEVAGHAPWGGEFSSYTLNVELDVWARELKQALQPSMITPGFWYPCSTTEVTSLSQTCSCTNIVGIFDSEQSGTSSSNNQWHRIRIAAFEAKAKVLEANSILKNYAGGNSDNAKTAIRKWSRFMILGTDFYSPSTCPQYGGGPCFPVFRHIGSDIHTTTSNAIGDVQVLENVNQGGWVADGISTLKCSVGWPAHYMCPDGYTWVAPNVSSLALENKILKPMTSQIACLSCIPGSYSYLARETKLASGGPYNCFKCNLGMFSSSVGSTFCKLCPAGTYSNVHGASVCIQCPPNHWTDEGAQTNQSCDPCPPGSGSCATCVAGHYQNMAAQGKCIQCPRGYVSNSSNMTTCSPCTSNTYQPRSGMAFCEKCPDGSYTMQSASTSCISCESTPSCNIAANGTCGVGCGLNYYYDQEGQQCVRCPENTINAFNPCAKSITACSASSAPGKYAIRVGPISGDAILNCALGLGPNTQLSGCKLCEPGMYASPNQIGICQLCQVGYFSSASNQSSCEACPAGRFAQDKGQAYQCFSCGQGLFSPTLASTSCTECPRGYFANDIGSMQCTPCPNGTWSNETAKKSGCENMCNAAEGWYSGSAATACSFCDGGLVDPFLDSKCVGCGLGMFEKTTGAKRECQPCGEGLVNLNESFANNETSCQPCPSAMDYSPKALLGALCYTAPLGSIPTYPIKNGIVKCPPGTYRSTQNLTCVLCQAGYVAENSGQAECRPCSQGSYAHHDGTTCLDCDLGLVSTEAASTACIPCAGGSISTSFGTACLPCPANTYQLDLLTCRECPWGKTSTPGSIYCQTCPPWTLFHGATRTCSLCDAGTFMYTPSANQYACSPCERGLHNPLSGANSSSACIRCSPGYIPSNTVSGATGCTTCPTGHREVNGISCEPCERGTFGVRGLACTPCYTGTYASASGVSRCDQCPPGSYVNATGQTHCISCEAGKFSNVSRSTSCLPCNSAENGYAPIGGLSACLPRTSTCNEGQYLQLQTDKPDTDNQCIDCQPCRADQWAFASDVEWWTNLVPPGACPGDSTSPGYTCISNTPEAGKYLAKKSSAGSTTYTSTAGGINSVQGIPCEELSPEALSLVNYVVGPTYECYLGCKYGVAIGGTGFTAYINDYCKAATHENPYNNIFYPRLATISSQICLACPLSTCPLGKYRPEYFPGCGPPCGLASYQQLCSTATNGQGCIGSCAAPPTGAVISGGAPGLGNPSSCPWTCSPGFHINEEKTGCRLCTENICESGYVLVSPDQCLTHHTKADICKRCDSIEGGIARGWNNQTQSCTYACFTGYYNTFGGSSCVSCTEALTRSTCPIGTFRDISSCISQGIEPLCVGCSTSSSQADLISFTTHGGTSKNNCSGLCIAGYHTTNTNTSQYIEDTGGALGMTVDQINCVLCKIGDRVPCHGNCSFGYFRNTSVISDATPGSCVPCTTNAQCGKGKYAPECSGHGTSDVGCHTCNQSMLTQNKQIVREFVSYEVQQQLVTTSIVYPSAPFACPSVCIPNYVAGSGSQCVSCQSYTQQKGCAAETKSPSEYAPLQPKPCDFVYSHWNATPDLVWWDFTPSFLPKTLVKSNDVKYNRRGICWACPVGTGTLPTDPDLCILLPGYGRPTLTPLIARQAIPTLPEDLYLTFQEPRPYFAALVPAKRRRNLLSDNKIITLFGGKAAETGVAIFEKGATLKNNDGASGGMLCTYGWYKAGSGISDCLACPYGTSTIAEGSYSISQCLCLPGWHRTRSSQNITPSAMGCAPCEQNTFRPADTVGEDGCLQCPPNETTHERKSSTRCSCIPGFVRNYSDDSHLCVPCPQGTYCNPCFEGQKDCPQEGVQITPCFPNSTSPPGSNSIANCTCLSGLIPFSTSSSSRYYCAPVPPTAVYNAATKKVGCKRGWTEQWSSSFASLGQQLLGCTLCPLGYYAEKDPSLFPFQAVTCIQCPKGTFAASKDVIGNCTPCLAPQTTMHEASTSPESCGCPLPTIKGPAGACIGCLSNQYFFAGICVDCPSFAISNEGATSQADCMCKPGYGMAKGCELCKPGKYSPTASNRQCRSCPPGSTTRSFGSKSILECGAMPDLCLAGYTWRSTNMGCTLTSSVV